VAVAFVVARDPSPGLADQILARCGEMLADFKVPRKILAVRDLPRSTVRKVNKVELRRLLAAGADWSTAEAGWLTDTELDPSGDAS
jgi:crotonobetaine/carnitine-CoA ligase